MRLTFWAGFWVFLADQASKWLVVHWLDLLNRHQIEVLPPYLTLRMAWNRGVNFGILSEYDMRWPLIGVAVVVSGFVLWWLRHDGGTRLTYISGGLLLGGALGNIIDRILYGAVADFLNMSCCGISNPYAFNLADVAIFAGAVGLVLFPGSGSGGQSGAKTRRRAKKGP